jgi:hypothetical protein
MTFLSASFLFGLLALPIPFLIHLWHRHRLKKVWFPSITLIKQAEQGERAFRKLRDIILLVLRTLALLFLVLAFADPLIFRRQKTVVLDDSWDMLTRSGNSTAFERGEKKARSLRNTGILLASGKEYPSSCKYQKYHLPTGETDYVITRAGKLPDTIDARLIEIDCDKSNFSVDSVMTPDVYVSSHSSEISGSNSSSLLAFVRNHTSQESSRLVTLSAETLSLEVRVSVMPYSTAAAVFPVPEACAGSVSIEEDALQLDNTRYFVCAPPRALKVFIIGDTDDAFFLRNALSPASSGSRVTVDVGNSPYPGADVSNPSGYDVVILVGPSSSDYKKTVLFPSRTQEVGGLLTLSSISEDHPIFRGFRFIDELKQIKFTHRKRLAISSAEEKPTVIAGFSDGSPAIVEHSSGRLEFLFPVDMESKELVMSPLFPPLMHRAMYWAAGKSSQRHNFDVGETIRVEVPEFKPYESVGGGKQMSTVPAISGSGIHLSLTPETPGIYEVFGIGKFAVNISNSLVYSSLDANRAGKEISVKKWFFLMVLLLLTAEFLVRRRKIV